MLGGSRLPVACVYTAAQYSSAQTYFPHTHPHPTTAPAFLLLLQGLRSLSFCNMWLLPSPLALIEVAMEQTLAAMPHLQLLSLRDGYFSAGFQERLEKTREVGGGALAVHVYSR